MSKDKEKTENKSIKDSHTNRSGLNKPLEDYEFDTSNYIQLPDIGVRRDPETGQLIRTDEKSS